MQRRVEIHRAVLDVFLGPHDNVEGGLCVGAVLERDVSITVSPTLGVSLVPTNGVGYGPLEVTQYWSDMGAYEDNPMGKNKWRVVRSNTGLCNILGPSFSGRSFFVGLVLFLGGS